MLDVDVMQDASEIVHYDKAGIPLYIRTSRLSSYPDMRALCHWHEDLEWICILKGNMNYDVNGKKLFLAKGDCLMINARQMHYGYSCGGQDCDFVCILFHPCLLTDNKILRHEFILPILENEKLPFLSFNSTVGMREEIAALLIKIAGLKSENGTSCEIEIIGLVHLLWQKVYLYTGHLISHETEPLSSDIAVQKAMVSYIYQHYAEKLTLAGIAASGNVCRSKCCLIFKRYLQQSPIDFLNACRLKVSCYLLETTDSNITQIALSCGFGHLSYFSKLFARSYSCTPGEYRKLYASRKKQPKKEP